MVILDYSKVFDTVLLIVLVQNLAVIVCMGKLHDGLRFFQCTDNRALF